MLKRLLLLAIAVAVVALVWLTFQAGRGNVPWRARDLDCNGSVSVAEWYSAGLEYGWRPAIDGPPTCWEVFSYKDGLPDTEWCPASPPCRRMR